MATHFELLDFRVTWKANFFFNSKKCTECRLKLISIYATIEKLHIFWKNFLQETLTWFFFFFNVSMMVREKLKIEYEIWTFKLFRARAFPKVYIFTLLTAIDFL